MDENWGLGNPHDLGNLWKPPYHTQIAGSQPVPGAPIGRTVLHRHAVSVRLSISFP